MEVHNLSQTHSVLNHFIHQLRDEAVQQDRMKFRRNIERIGEILTYEMSKALAYTPHNFQTPLIATTSHLCKDEIVVCSILRAGIPLHNGILNYLDEADNAFISAYRKVESNGKDFEIVVEYLSSPSLEGKTLVLADPMLATGRSMLNVYKALEKLGQPKQIHIVSVIGAQAGVDLIEEHFPEDTQLWIAAVDDTLNEKGYIIPGLGDAGDLAFGEKM